MGQLIKSTLSGKLRYFRKRYEYTLQDLSVLSGLSVSFLSDIETGRTIPSLMTCQKLADVYGITLQGLFSNVGRIEGQSETEAQP